MPGPDCICHLITWSLTVLRRAPEGRTPVPHRHHLIQWTTFMTHDTLKILRVCTLQSPLSRCCWCRDQIKSVCSKSCSEEHPVSQSSTGWTAAPHSQSPDQLPPQTAPSTTPSSCFVTMPAIIREQKKQAWASSVGGQTLSQWRLGTMHHARQLRDAGAKGIKGFSRKK